MSDKQDERFDADYSKGVTRIDRISRADVLRGVDVGGYDGCYRARYDAAGNLEGFDYLTKDGRIIPCDKGLFR